MRRRDFIGVVGGVAAWPLAARAQQPATPVIGFLDVRSPEAIRDRLVAFRQGLKETGFVEGDNVTIAFRWAENRTERLPELAADLVRLKEAHQAADLDVLTQRIASLCAISFFLGGAAPFATHAAAG